MTQIECRACDRPTDATLCHPCTRKLTAVLDDLPQWLAELETTVTQQAKTSAPDGAKATKKAEQPLPYHPAAAELLDQADTGLRSWVVYVADTRKLPVVRGGRDARHAAHWLSHYASEEIRHTDRADELAVAATALRDACRRMVDNLGRRWAGPCTANVVERHLEVVIEGEAITANIADEPASEPRECGADLRTRPGDKTIVCKACGATYDPIDRAQWIIAKSVEHQATAAFVAAALTDAGWPVKANTLRQWASRGKLYAWREDEQGRPLYRVGDVLDLVRAARADAGVRTRDTPGIPA